MEQEARLEPENGLYLSSDHRQVEVWRHGLRFTAYPDLELVHAHALAEHLHLAEGAQVGLQASRPRGPSFLTTNRAIEAEAKLASSIRVCQDFGSPGSSDSDPPAEARSLSGPLRLDPSS